MGFKLEIRTEDLIAADDLVYYRAGTKYCEWYQYCVSIGGVLLYIDSENFSEKDFHNLFKKLK